MGKQPIRFCYCCGIFRSGKLRARFGQTSGQVRANFGLGSGKLRARFGQTSGQVRANFGLGSGKLRARFGQTSGQVWANFGQGSGKLRARFGQTSGQVWANFGLGSGKLRARFGQTSGQVRANFGLGSGKLRARFGQTSGKMCSRANFGLIGSRAISLRAMVRFWQTFGLGSGKHSGQSSVHNFGNLRFGHNFSRSQVRALLRARFGQTSKGFRFGHQLSGQVRA